MLVRLGLLVILCAPCTQHSAPAMKLKGDVLETPTGVSFVFIPAPLHVLTCDRPFNVPSTPPHLG